jgi:hypothetical protein
LIESRINFDNQCGARNNNAIANGTDFGVKIIIATLLAAQRVVQSLLPANVAIHPYPRDLIVP